MSLLPEVSVFVFAGVLRWLVGGLKVRSNLYLAGISLLKGRFLSFGEDFAGHNGRSWPNVCFKAPFPLVAGPDKLKTQRYSDDGWQDVP